MCKVSIIIPTYNNAHLLPETLESIFNQDYGDYELIVIDDGSSDNTKELVESYGNKIKYVYQVNSGGCSKPRNVGIGHACGEYIAMFDSDDVMKPDKIRLQAEFLDNNQNVGFVFTDFCDFCANTMSINHIATCTIFNNLEKESVGGNAYKIDHTSAYETLLSENFIGGSSMMFRKRLFEETGPFDETLEVSEDIDFTLRVARKHDLGFINRVGHLRRLHEGNITAKAEKLITRSLRVFGAHLSVPKSPESQRRLIDKIADLHGSLAYYYRENTRYRDAFHQYKAALNLQPCRFRIYKAMLKLAVMALVKGGR